MRPTQIDGFLFGLTRQQAVEKAGGETITAANTVIDVQLAGAPFLKSCHVVAKERALRD